MRCILHLHRLECRNVIGMSRYDTRWLDQAVVQRTATFGVDGWIVVMKNLLTPSMHGWMEFVLPPVPVMKGAG